MGPWEPFTYIIIRNGTNTTREDVLFPQQTQEYEHVITNVSAEDADNNITSARLIVSNGVHETSFREWLTVSGGNLMYENRADLPLAVGERAGVAFYGITSGDTLHVSFKGQRRRVD